MTQPTAREPYLMRLAQRLALGIQPMDDARKEQLDLALKGLAQRAVEIREQVHRRFAGRDQQCAGRRQGSGAVQHALPPGSDREQRGLCGAGGEDRLAEAHARVVVARLLGSGRRKVREGPAQGRLAGGNVCR